MEKHPDNSVAINFKELVTIINQGLASRDLFGTTEASKACKLLDEENVIQLDGEEIWVIV